MALDIALRGRAGSHIDVDNVAHTILREFERVFAAARPEVAGYRVYRQPAAKNDVRVRLMPAVRLKMLGRSMERARELVREQRAERAKE